MRYANGYTKESVIAKVRAGNNGTRAMNDLGECLYKVEDNNKCFNKCFIGCFIPEGHQAQTKVESVVALLTQYPELQSFMPFKETSTLASMQIAHDNCLIGQSTYDALDKWFEIENVKMENK